MDVDFNAQFAEVLKEIRKEEVNANLEDQCNRGFWRVWNRPSAHSGSSPSGISRSYVMSVFVDSPLGVP